MAEKKIDSEGDGRYKKATKEAKLNPKIQLCSN